MSLLEPLRAFLQTRSNDVYLVGGAVRDILLGRETYDLDLSVRGNASALARAFADEIGAAYFQMDEQFDVARVILDREGARELVDFARLRGEGIRDDLGTRDFTINAMAADLYSWQGDAESVIDPFHGRADLEAHLVRAVTPDVFVNDPVRLLRGARLEVVLNLKLDAATEALVKRDAERVGRAPMERVRDELVKILAADELLKNLRRLDELGLLGVVLPELNATRGVTQSAPHIYEVFEHSLYAAAAAEETERAGYANLAEGAFAPELGEHMNLTVSADRRRWVLLRLALLLHDIGKPATRTVQEDGRIRFLGHEEVGAAMVEPALRRLKFSNDEIALARTIVANHLRPLQLAQSGVSDRAVYRFFRDTGEAGVDVVVHAWCDQRATYGRDAVADDMFALQEVIGRMLERLYRARARVVSPPLLVTGHDVMELLNTSPGPHIRALLDAVREAQAEGKITTREQALEFIKKFDPPA